MLLTLFQGGRKFIILGVVLVLSLWLIYSLATHEKSPLVQIKENAPIVAHLKMDVKRDSSDFWNKLNLQELKIPVEVLKNADSIQVNEGMMDVDGTKVFFRKSDGNNKEITILLLHGMAFSSKTWFDLHTIQILASMGYPVVAIDLPGFAQSPKADVQQDNFLEKVISAFKLNRPVIVSPSMSGMFAIPHLLKNWNTMGGYIPVAPVGADRIKEFSCKETADKKSALSRVPSYLQPLLPKELPNLDCIKTPTMVVFGEFDRASNSALLSLLPWSVVGEIPQGKHPAYLTNPALWHQYLYNFLLHVCQLYK